MNLQIWEYPLHLLAYGLGTGLLPLAPGTFGSLLGILLFWLMAPLKTAKYAGIVIILAVLGVFICGQTAQHLGAADPGMIVFDEIVGFLVAMFLMPRKWQWVVPGFIIYRVFDIWKPWPIHAAEEWFSRGGGIMADDIIAGLYTLAILTSARLLLRSNEIRS